MGKGEKGNDLEIGSEAPQLDSEGLIFHFLLRRGVWGVEEGDRSMFSVRG